MTVDRLGYGPGAHPDGNQNCIGSQADVAHQIVQSLRNGSYAVASGKAVRYKRVALAGHSAAGEISILEAYSYKDVNALIVVAFSYSNLAAANIAFGNQRNSCQAGGDPVPGYAFFGQTGAEFQQTFFHSAVKAVRDRPRRCTRRILAATTSRSRMRSTSRLPVRGRSRCRRS